MLKNTISFVIRLLVTCGIFFVIFDKLIVFEDYVIDIDGHKIEGKILNYADENVCLQKNDGTVINIPKQRIANCKDSNNKEVHFGFFTVWQQLCLPLYLLFSSLMFLNLVLGSIRFKWLLDSQQMSLQLAKIVKINFVGIFFNNFLPGFTGGDLIRAYYIARGVEQKTRAVVAVLMDRIIGLSALVILAASVMLFHLAEDKFFYPILIIYGCLGALCLGGLLIYFLPEKLFVGKQSLMFRTIQAFCRYRHSPKPLGMSIAISLLIHFLTNIAIFGFSRAIGIDYVPWFVFFIYVPVAVLLMAVPISLSGYGVGEAIFGFLFAMVGVPIEQGIVLCLLMRLAQIQVGLIGGLIWIRKRNFL